jgi:hypothetical protein
MPVLSTQEAKARGKRVQGQPGLHSQIVSQTNKNETYINTHTSAEHFD